jgi:hypothetical protein
LRPDGADRCRYAEPVTSERRGQLADGFAELGGLGQGTGSLMNVEDRVDRGFKGRRELEVAEGEAAQVVGSEHCEAAPPVGSHDELLRADDPAGTTRRTLQAFGRRQLRSLQPSRPAGLSR